jgi:hypothetical protein
MDAVGLLVLIPDTSATIIYGRRLFQRILWNHTDSYGSKSALL